jgi:hypothetical protein
MPGLARIAIAQGAYYLVTGVWPLFHMPSFLGITGPKTDLWLVKTFGVLIAVIGVHFLGTVIRGRNLADLKSLAILVAAAIAVTESWFVLEGEISAVYLLDAVVELGFVTLWAAFSWERRVVARPATHS